MRRPFLLSLALFSLAVATPAAAQTAEPGWTFNGKVTAVFAGGNATSSTLGVGSMLRRTGSAWELKLEDGAVRTQSGITTRKAIGTADNHRIEEETRQEKTAEAFFARARIDRKVESGLVLFGGVDWSRNTFAGIDSRTLLAAGAGNVWSATDDLRFKTDYGFTYTFRTDVIDNPFTKQNFPGLRVSYDLLARLTESTTLESGFVTDLNIQNTEDVESDFTGSLAIAINKSLSLKPGIHLLWRNDPALTRIDLYGSNGVATGQTVLVPLQKLDRFLDLALVVTLH